jgi:hypothetical protein
LAGDKPAKKVTITSEEKQPLEILETSSTLEDTIAYKLTTIEKGKSYSVEITTPSGLRESFRGQIRLKTNSQKKPNIELTVIGLVQKEIKAAPQYIYFGIIDTSTTTSDQTRLTRTVQVSRARGATFTIEKVATNPDRIKTEVVPGTNGGNYSLVITLLTDNLQKGILKEEVKVHTKYNTTSEIITVFVEAKIN